MFEVLKKHTVAFFLVVAVFAGCSEHPGRKEFDQAIRHFEQERWERARELFTQAINRAPGHEANADAFHYLGVIDWKLNSPAAAAAFFERSYALRPDVFETVYNLGVLSFEMNDLSSAQRYFLEAAELDSLDARPLEYLAEIRMQTGHYAAAHRLLHQARELMMSPTPRLLTALGTVVRHDEGNEAAISYWMRALEKDPAYAPALYNLARVYESMPDATGDAMAYYRHFLELAPQSGAATHARSRLARLERGDTAPEDAGSIPDAPEDGVETPPVPTPPRRPPTPTEWLELAREQAQQGNVQRALATAMRVAAQARQEGEDALAEKALRQATALAPEEPAGWYDLARLQAAQERYHDALPAFQAATERAPDWPAAWMGVAQSARQLGDYDVALDAVQRAVALDPLDPDPLWALAQLYDETRIRRRATEQYDRFQQQFPTDPRSVVAIERLRELRPAEDDPARTQPGTRPTPAAQTRAAREAFQRAVAFHRQGDQNSALRLYQQAATADPAMEQAHFNAGVILLNRNDWQGSRDAFEASLELRPDRVNTLYNLALACFHLGDSNAAIHYLEQALGVDPDYARAHMLLGSVYAQRPHLRADAQWHYRRFLDLAPNDPGAPSVRAWLSN